MIKIFSDVVNLKINKIEFEYNELKKHILPKIFTVCDRKNNNIGGILEEYRNLEENADKFYRENKSVLDEFIQNYNSPFTLINPDCVVCFLPEDTNRKQLLINYKEKIIASFENKTEIDFSGKFFKKDKSKSIKNGLTKQDFELVIMNDMPFNSIIIIDDVINKGSTVNIFLEMMTDIDLIDESTEINMVFIYCLKTLKNKHANPLEAHKDWIKNNS